ncbi:MAG TPA: hypothetical protein VFC29_16205 [Candidatus Limnocylindrales bacterium]|nr:hypothetical protein [Candidatus Limnocylindrales bacterium]
MKVLLSVLCTALLLACIATAQEHGTQPKILDNTAYSFYTLCPPQSTNSEEEVCTAFASGITEGLLAANARCGEKLFNLPEHMK